MYAPHYGLFWRWCAVQIHVLPAYLFTTLRYSRCSATSAVCLVSTSASRYWPSSSSWSCLPAWCGSVWSDCTAVRRLCRPHQRRARRSVTLRRHRQLETAVMWSACRRRLVHRLTSTVSTTSFNCSPAPRIFPSSTAKPIGLVPVGYR